MSEAMAQGLLDMMIAKDNGLDDGIARTPQNAIDTPTFRQWCEDTSNRPCRPTSAASSCVRPPGRSGRWDECLVGTHRWA
jgi:hypothetical protein